MRAGLSLLAATLLAGCATTSVAKNPQDEFFASLSARCGKAYAGRLASDQEADAEMRDKAMVLHIRHCTDDRIEIPFHIDGLAQDGGWDRSRTWIITRTPAGLRLKHDHRHADGSPDAITLYGGDSKPPGTAERQQFPADGESVAMFRRADMLASTHNTWAMEIEPDQRFVYELTRPEERRFRVEFDLSKPVALPPAPWGDQASPAP